MTYFIDTSALAKRYLQESGASLVEEILEQSKSVFASSLTEIEIVSAIERARRESRIDSPSYRHVAALLTQDLYQSPFILVDISSDVKTLAKRLIRQRKLRTLDSLQLATALMIQKRIDEDVRFLCFDQALLDAARLEGLKCVPI